MALDSYNKFKEYCLRALGQDDDLVLKVNVTEKQLKDRIEDALKKWQDFHFEGSTFVNIHKNITAEDQRKGYMEIDDLNAITQIFTTNDSNKTNVEIMDDLDYRFALEYAENFGRGGTGEYMLTDYHINMEYLASMAYMFNVDKLFTFNATTNRLYLDGNYPAATGPNLLEEFSGDNWDFGTGTLITPDIIELADGSLAGTKIENTDAGVNPILVSYTSTTTHYPRGLRTFSINLMSGTYSGRVKLEVLDRAGNIVSSKNVQPVGYWKKFEIEAHYKEPHINDFIFRMTTIDDATNQYFHAHDPVGYRNNFIILSGYATASPDDSDLIWESGWLKEYSIARIKWQWANNLKKFEGVQMAGGVTLNGQAMYDESIEEMSKLNEDLELKWGAPARFFIG